MIGSLSARQRLCGWGLLAVVLLVSVAVGPSAAAVSNGDGTGETVFFQQSTNGTEPPPHRNPEESGSNTDAELQTSLRGSMTEAIAASNAQLSQGEYEQARELLSEQYEGDLSRYSELAGQQAELFATLQSNQQQYIDAVATYEETRAEYEQARAEDDSEQARVLAHELDRAADGVDRNSTALIRSYEAVSNETGEDFSQRIADVEARRSEVRETQTRVTEAELIETELSVTVDQSTVSFTDSLSLSGELRTADGEPVDRETARIRVQNRTYTVDLGSDGEFERSVEPTNVWYAVDELQVAYRPEGGSAYRGSTTTVPISVQSTETAVEIDAASDRASYDEPMEISGTVTASETGDPAPGVPVELRVDGRQTATTNTTTDGEFSFEQPPPAGLPPGDTDVTVGLIPSSASLEPSSAETTVTIESTPATVSVDATTGEDYIQVRGSVQSADGRSVAETPVTIRIAGTDVGTVETDDSGAFRERFALPDDSAGDSVEIAATVEGAGSIESATDSTTVDVPETLATTGVASVLSPIQIALLAVVGLLGVVGAVSWWLRQQSTPLEAPGAEEESVSAATQNTDLLTAAVDRLNEGADEAATTLAYAAVRNHLRERVDSSRTATHWEWYRACGRAGVDRLSELETLTETFEQVTFAPDHGGDGTAADRAVRVARQIIDPDE
jgi:hypothetical protein